MAKYGMCGNAQLVKKDSKHLYINGQPKIHGNIVGYINNSKGINSLANCIFVEYENDKYDFMLRKIRSFLDVVPIVTFIPSDEILLHYNINKYTPSCMRHLDSGDPDIFIKPG